MHHLIGTIAVGGLAGLATRTGARQGLRRLVRGGIVAKRKLQALGGTIVEQAQGLVDEARADLDEQVEDQRVKRSRRASPPRNGVSGKRRR
jgi:hypothetical protein